MVLENGPWQGHTHPGLSAFEAGIREWKVQKAISQYYRAGRSGSSQAKKKAKRK
jgi:hypothetical protein